MEDYQSLGVFLVLAASCAISLHMLRKQSSYMLTAVLYIFAFYSLWVFTNYGKFHWVPKKDPSFVVVNNGSFDKRTYFHWHEIYHYYLGAKYYYELNNTGLYEAVLLADTESSNPMISLKRIRDVSNRTQSISIEEALNRAKSLHRPKFSDARWQEFTRDLGYMKSIAAPEWLNVGMFDAGFNPPPSWCVIGTPIANMLPISSPILTLPPQWDQAEFLPLIDVVLMAVALGYFWCTFGVVPALLLIITFGTSFISSGSWISGSFLRYGWLSSIIIAMCMMKKERWNLAGIFMGIASMLILFPVLFAMGTVIALLWNYQNKKPNALQNLTKFCVWFVFAAALMFLLSLLMFGVSYWQVFFKQITVHNNLFFVWHIGYKRIAVWDSWVPNQSFWWDEGLGRFAVWNDRLLESWNHDRWFQWPFITILTAACVWASRKLSVEETTLLFGGLVFFLTSIPANYYYAYMSLIPAVFFAQHKNWREELLLFSFFFLWVVLYYVTGFSRDSLVNNYRVCVSIFLFFLGWLATRYFDRNTDQG